MRENKQHLCTPPLQRSKTEVVPEVLTSRINNKILHSKGPGTYLERLKKRVFHPESLN